MWVHLGHDKSLGILVEVMRQENHGFQSRNDMIFFICAFEECSVF